MKCWEELDWNKEYPITNKEELMFFVDFALCHSVDYVYILEAIMRVLKGEQKSFVPKYYEDY